MRPSPDRPSCFRRDAGEERREADQRGHGDADDDERADDQVRVLQSGARARQQDRREGEPRERRRDAGARPREQQADEHQRGAK